jgi:acyl-coenzyme A thioesterase PaaI-like protein
MTEATLKLQPGGRKFRDRVKNPTMFRVYMLAKAPVLGVTGAYLDIVEPAGCEMVVPFGRTTKNLFGNMFASAISAAAETTSAASLVLHVRNQDASLTAELVALYLEELRPVQEEVRVIDHNGEQVAEFVERAAGGGDDQETFKLRVIDRSGEATHRVEVTWRLKPKS